VYDCKAYLHFSDEVKEILILYSNTLFYIGEPGSRVNCLLNRVPSSGPDTHSAGEELHLVVEVHRLSNKKEAISKS